MNYDRDQKPSQAFSLAVCSEGIAPFLRIGGAPQLPDTLNWPKDADGQPLHFFGAFDFAKLPKSFGGTKPSPIPEAPSMGTGLIFLNMFAHTDDQFEMVILCSEQSNEVILDGALPDDLQPMLPSSEYVDQALLSDCGRMFLRSDHVLTPMAPTKRPSVPKAPEFQTLEAAFNAVLDDSNTPLDHMRSIELAEKIIGGFYSAARNELHHWAIQGVNARTVESLEGLLENKREKAHTISINDTAPFMDRLRYANAKLPKPTDVLDDLFISWMRYARANREGQRAPEKLTDQEMAWFRAACDRIVELENDTSPPRLRCLDRMRNHDLTGADIADHTRDVITARVARAVEIAARKARPPVVFPEFKMFGTSDGDGKAAWDDAAHILPFQLGDAFGPKFLKIDTLLQIWIRPSDLAQGRFDRIGVAGELAY